MIPWSNTDLTPAPRITDIVLMEREIWKCGEISLKVDIVFSTVTETRGCTLYRTETPFVDGDSEARSIDSGCL